MLVLLSFSRLSLWLLNLWRNAVLGMGLSALGVAQPSLPAITAQGTSSGCFPGVPLGQRVSRVLCGLQVQGRNPVHVCGRFMILWLRLCSMSHDPCM